MKRRRRSAIRPRVELLEIRALLTVPTVVGLQTLNAPAGQVKIALEFSEAMNSARAGDPSNYFVAPDGGAGLRVTTASYDSPSDTVTLTAQPVAGQSLANATYRVRVDGHHLTSALGVAMVDPGSEVAVLVDDRNAIVTVGATGPGAVGIEGVSSLGYSPPISFATADFNGDGVIDLVSADTGYSSVSVVDRGIGSLVYLQGLGGGKFADPVSFDLDAKFAGVKVIAADWNGDGKTDVVISASKTYYYEPFAESIYIFLNDGKGNFSRDPDTPLKISGGSGSIEVADVLPGGGPEILAYQQGYYNIYAGNPEEGKIQILGKDPFLGYNRIMTVDLGAAMNPSQILHGDFNGDGRDDIVTGDITGVYVVMTTPTGLAPARKLAFDGFYSGTLRVGDIDGDGKLDIVDLHEDYSNNAGVGDGDIISVFKGDGKGGFTDLPGQVMGRRGSNLAGLVDYNGDGKLDLLLTETWSDGPGGWPDVAGPSTWVWRGDGKGGFLQPSGDPTLLYASASGISLAGSAVTDINGDGEPDALFSTSATGRFLVLDGDRAGNLVAPVVPGPYIGSSVPITTGSTNEAVTNIAVADFNRDGLPDIAKSSGSTISLSMGGEDGAFHPRDFLAVADSGNSAAAGIQSGDLNNDGIMDLVVGNNMSVYLGRGDGTFSAGISYSDSNSVVANFKLADVNNDGKLDAVVLQNTGADGAYAVYFGDGTGKLIYNPNTVTPRSNAYYQPVYVYNLSVGDFDGDGKVDILDLSLTGAGIRLLHGNGNGKFTPQADYDPGQPAARFFVGDLDGDGRPDAVGIVRVSDYRSDVFVYLNDGSGHLAVSGTTGISGLYFGVSLSDLNGDGSLDLVVSRQGGDGVGPVTASVQAALNDGHGHLTAQPSLDVQGKYSLAAVPYDARGTVSVASFSLTVPSSVAFASAAVSATEVDGSASFVVNRTGDTASVATIDYATSDGTGKAGTNYTAASGTLTFSAGQTTKTIVVPILDDHLVSGPHTVIVTLSHPSGASLGDMPSATVTIADSDKGGAIAFSAATYRGNAADGKATITASRTGGDAGAVTVHYATANGSASSGTDYAATSGTLTFAAGELAKSFDVSLLAGGAMTDRTVTLALTAPTGGGSLGATATSTLTITPFAAPVAPSFGFASALYQGDDRAGDLVVTVKRDGSTAGTDSVRYSITPKSATAGVDYADASGTLTFAPAEFAKTFAIHRLDNRASTGDRSATLVLSSPSSGSSVQTPASAGLVIHDTDPAPPPAATTLGFSRASYSVGEKAGLAPITVVRGGDLSAAVAVDFFVAAGTAMAGSDFVAVSGTLRFGSGEFFKTFNVPILDDTLVEDAETVLVRLATPSGPGAALGSIASATLTIVSDDVAKPDPKPDPGPPPDTTGPRVIAIAVGGSGKSKINDILIRFSEALDGASALDLTHYSLQPSAPGGKPVKIQGATYNAAIQTVTLHLSASLTTAQAQLLTVRGMHDVAGNVLDGDRSGTPGGRAFTYGFSGKKSILDQITTSTITDPWGPSKPKFKFTPFAKAAPLKLSYTVSGLKVVKVDRALFNVMYDRGAAVNSATQVLVGAVLEFWPNATFRLTSGGGALLISNGSWAKSKGGVDFRGDLSSVTTSGTAEIRIIGHLDLTAKGGPNASVSYTDHRGSALPPFDFDYAIEGTLSLS